MSEIPTYYLIDSEGRLLSRDPVPARLSRGGSMYLVPELSTTEPPPGEVEGHSLRWSFEQRRWEHIPDPPEEPEEEPPLPPLTRHRARAMLLQREPMVTEEMVEEAINAAFAHDERARRLALNDWRESPTYRPDHGLVTAVAALLGIAEEEWRAAWLAAAAL